MRRALFFIVAIVSAATSFASIPDRAREDAAALFTPLPETRVWASEVLAPFERPARSELSRAVHQAYAESSTTRASGLRCFLSVDPVIDFKTNLRNPQGWNRYSYVRNNPMRWTDPTGKVIEYDDEFRKRVKNDKVFREAFEAWKKTKSGAAQWRAMARDTDTKYTLKVGDASYQPSLLSHRFQANGRTVPPPAMARENKWGQLNNPSTESVIDADRMSDGGSTRTQARTIAGALFEEVAHALDLGSSSRTERGAYMAEEQFHADPSPTEPRWIRFMEELNQVLPPEP